MTIRRKKPKGMLRWWLRMPILLYRWNLGWVLGERFLLLTHTGRKSGLPRQTVIEVVGQDTASGSFYVVSGFGKKADWFLNLQAHPKVKVTVKNRSFEAEAGFPVENEAVQILLGYAHEHPFAFKELSRTLLGEVIAPTFENILMFLKDLPMIKLQPLKRV